MNELNKFSHLYTVYDYPKQIMSEISFDDFMPTGNILLSSHRVIIRGLLKEKDVELSCAKNN